MKKRVALYTGAGPVVTHYEVDVDGHTLTKRGSVTLPSNVQYAWPHSSKPVLYAATSSRVNRNDLGTEHFLCALKIDEATGGISLHGKNVRLPGRPVHCSVDIPNKHVLLAFNRPSNLMVFRIEADGTLGEAVSQRADMDLGGFPHQVRVTPDNRLAILVNRGHSGPNPEQDEQKEPGALKVFEYRDGVLGREVSVAPGGGKRYGARHLDFHPTKPLIYVSVETQNKITVHKREGDAVVAEPVFTKETLLHPGKTLAQRQCAGTIHFHPNGRVVYGVNRGVIPQASENKPFLVAPDNTLVVYALDPDTGEPRLIQHIDSEGLSARTFSIDPSGRMLVAGNSETYPLKQREGDPVQTMSANLAVFRILEDGKLEFKRKYDVELGPKQGLFWMGIVPY